MEAKLSLEALKASVLPTLDIVIPQGAGPTKFKRVRQPAGAAPSPLSAPSPSSASSHLPASVISTTATPTTAIATTSNIEMKTASAFKVDTPDTQSVTTGVSAIAAASSASSFKKQAPRQLSKPVPDDLQAAAAAIFAPLTPVATPDFSSESAAIAHPVVVKAPGQESDDSNKKKRRRKGKNNNNNSNQSTEGSVAKEAVAGRGDKASGTFASKKQKMNNAGSTSTTPMTMTAKKPKDPNAVSAAAKKRAKVRVTKLARSLDAQPELVGLSTTPEDDFDTLLNQHYEHTNKMLQRDIEEETRKAAEQIKKQQRELAALTAQMMFEVEAASNPAPFSGTAAPSTQSATESLDGSKTTGSNSKEKQPFVPRRDCMYYIKGRCFKDKECTFRHDPSAIQTAEPQVQVPKIESEEVRRSRGVCRFHKTGCCTRGDYCRQSHNLKSEPCSFYHLQGQCSRGDECQFGHTPISPEEHQALVADITAKMKRKAEALAAHQALDAEIASRMSQGSHGTQGLFV